MKLLRNFCLKGRKYVIPTDLSANEMRYIIMTALQLKTSKENTFQYLAGRNITFLLDSPCLRLQTCLHNTSRMLKMSLNILISSELETMAYPEDMGKLLSSTTDIIFFKAHRQTKLERFAKGSTVPVINLSSCRFMMLQGLSNLLTAQQHFGTLQDLIISWIGPASPLLNTYLTIAPTLNVKVHFLCFCGGPVSPSSLDYVLKQDKEYVGKVQEYSNFEEAIKGAHVISTTDYSDDTIKLNYDYLNQHAENNWIYLHTLPRKLDQVDNKIFDSDKNLLWRAYTNYKWICAAIISKFLE